VTQLNRLLWAESTVLRTNFLEVVHQVCWFTQDAGDGRFHLHPFWKRHLWIWILKSRPILLLISFHFYIFRDWFLLRIFWFRVLVWFLLPIFVGFIWSVAVAQPFPKFSCLLLLEAFSFSHFLQLLFNLQSVLSCSYNTSLSNLLTILVVEDHAHRVLQVFELLRVDVLHLRVTDLPVLHQWKQDVCCQSLHFQI